MRIKQLGLIALALSLAISGAGCKKKVPAPAAVVVPKPDAPPPPPPPPPAKAMITSFTAEPSTIEKGQSSTLKWATTNATKVTITPGVGDVAQMNGSRSVSPGSTTTYTLVAEGPGGSATQTATVTVNDPPPPPPTPKPVVKEEFSSVIARELADISFDYDKSDVREDARGILTRNADKLKQLFADYPTNVLTIEGHCDERGSAEYNLGLGDRRAIAAKDFLQQLGIGADRLRTVSYGKERPQCTDANEACYAKNRRAHFSGN